MLKLGTGLVVILVLSVLVPLLIPPAAIATEEMEPVAPLIGTYHSVYGEDQTPGSSCRAVYGVCVMPCVTVVEK